jgi:aminoglycoside 3-N-acetyltransferase I
MNLDIQKLSSQNLDDFVELIKVFEDVFEMKDFSLPDKKHLQRVLNNQNFIVFTAKTENKVIGGLTVYVLDQYYSAKPLAYVYDLAVLTEFQKQGIGKLLITNLIDYCKKNGFEEVYVQAETHDLQAINFYRTTIINSEIQAIQFSYSFEKNQY